MSTQKQSSTFYCDVSDYDLVHATEDDANAKYARDMYKLKAENQRLKTLLSDLHRYVTSHTEMNDSHFEQPSTINPGTPLASQNRQAQDIYDTFRKIKRQMQDLRDEKEVFEKKFQVQKELNTAIDTKWKSDLDLLQSIFVRLEIKEKEGVQLKTAYDGEVTMVQIQQKQIYDLQREREELLNRFSKLAADILIHENTNIMDLSDTDRPMKLSDVYSELYDNEWTDAFEELIDHGLTEKNAVGKLLNILLVSFDKCRKNTWERYQTLKSVVSTIDIVHTHSCVGTFSESEEKLAITSSESHLVSDNPDNKNRCSRCSSQKDQHLNSTTMLSSAQDKQIKDIWKTTTSALKDEAVKHLYTVLVTSFDISIKDLANTSKYLTKCIDLCWKMGVQEKPMHVDAVAEKDDGSAKIFDLDKFRAYTKSGERVDFIVWPALFLYEGGPILVKGIAQGCNKSDK